MTLAKKCEQGNVTIISLLGTVILAFSMTMAIYVAFAYVSWSCMNNALESAKNTITGTSFQVKIKSSTHPGREVAEKIASSFRSSGYQEKLSVWFYESNLETLGDNVRAMSVVAQSYYDVETNLAADPIHIVCETSSYFVPYSETRVFKPNISPKVLKYDFPYGSTNARESQNLLEESPHNLTVQINKAEQLALTY